MVLFSHTLLSLALLASLAHTALASAHGHDERVRHVRRHDSVKLKRQSGSGSGRCHAKSATGSSTSSAPSGTVSSKAAGTATHVTSSSATGPAATPPSRSGDSNPAGSCFPALDFKMPQDAPGDLDGWWCDPATEYAFVGFSYEITACQSAATLKADFANIRKKYNGRYVRLYGACDKDGYYNNVVDAAWEAGLGVHALVWFGFSGGDKWKSRRDDLFATLHANPKAKFVTRVVQFGSEPLFDGVLPAAQLAAQVQAAQAALKGLQIPVTISEMSFGYQTNGGAGLKVMDVVDPVDAHMLPFFGGSASTAKASWKYIQNDIDNFWVKHANGKKIYLTENGWPSEVADASQRPNSKSAVASVQQEHDYFALLDSQCAYFKSVPGGGVAWFAHIYSDDQEPGYGILDSSGKPKFSFQPRTHC